MTYFVIIMFQDHIMVEKDEQPLHSRRYLMDSMLMWISNAMENKITDIVVKEEALK